MMRVAILQCDNLMEKLQPKFGQYSDMIQQMFAGFNEPFHFDLFDCQKEEYPADISEYDFFITTGCRSSAYDEEPWIQSLVAFVRELEQNKSKLIGICFGHQIIGLALDGEVEKSVKGWNIGMATHRILFSPDWMQQKSSELNILVSHQDQVTRLPDGARVLAESDFCPYFMVQWSDHFLSIQGHPEWNRDYSRALMHERRAVIPTDSIDKGLLSLEQAPDNQLFAQWIVDFVTNQNQ